MPLPSVTAGVPTKLRLGATNTLTDTFIAHPASPTGAIIDLNDGTNWSLADDSSGMGTGLDWGLPRPTIYSSKNPRTVGARVTRRVYEDQRTVKVKLVLGQNTSWAAFIANLRNLEQLLEGISPDNPAALEFRSVQSSTSVYLDVLAGWFAKANYEETTYNQLIAQGIEVEFFCRPFFRGARQTLQNLVVNPGFEAPSGPGVQVFADTFANTNAYSVRAGASPTLATPQYKNVVLGDAPLRYYRLDQASGTVATDSSTAAQNGTYSATGITYSVGGALSGCGDADTAVTLASASPGTVSVPTTGLSTGNGAWTLECWFKITANPASFGVLAFMGTNAARNGAQMYLNSSGNVIVDAIGIGGVTTPGVASLNTWHHAVGTWDGTTMRLYLDGAAMGTPTTPGALTLAMGSAFLGQQPAGSSPYNGSIDEACIYGVALSAAQVLNHYTVATTSSTNTMTLPATSRVAFGSPNWGAVNTWQLRFLFMKNMAYDLYLHYTDANNWLKVNCTGTTYTVVHNIAGVTSTRATVTQSLTNGTWYWWKITQFPLLTTTDNTTQVQVQAALYNDTSGAVGSKIVTVGPASTSDNVTALAGIPQMFCGSANLVIGGNYSNVHTWSLFGPGAWTFTTSGTVAALGAWDQNTANTYASGPIGSLCAVRIDFPATGNPSANWETYNGGDSSGTWAINVTTGNVVAVSAYTRSSGLSVTASISLLVREWDTNGSLLRSTTVRALTGNQASWVQLAGTVTIGASTLYMSVQVLALDSTSNSANGSIWFDNVQAYNQTTTGQTSMPYCELKFPQSPAQPYVSGVLGDVPAPAFTMLGTYFSVGGSPAGSQQSLFALGRREVAATAVRLCGNMSSAAPGSVTPMLDTTVFGGYALQSTFNGQGFPSYYCDATQQMASLLLGTFHVWTRLQSAEVLAQLGKVSASASSTYGGPLYSTAVTSTTTPLTASTTYTACDLGQLVFPPMGAGGTLYDASQSTNTLSISTGDSYSGATATAVPWWALLPTVGSLALGTFVNNTYLTHHTVWAYLDGMSVLRGFAPIATISGQYLQAMALPQPATAVIGPANFSTIAQVGAPSIGVNSTADPYLTLDPTLRTPNANGVNQFVGFWADNGGVYGDPPLFLELQYVPLYLFPL